MATHALWNLLQQLKSDYEWVELSHRLNNDSPYWSGMPEGSVEIGKTVFGLIMSCKFEISHLISVA